MSGNEATQYRINQMRLRLGGPDVSTLELRLQKQFAAFVPGQEVVYAVSARFVGRHVEPRIAGSVRSVTLHRTSMVHTASGRFNAGIRRSQSRSAIISRADLQCGRRTDIRAQDASNAPTTPPLPSTGDTTTRRTQSEHTCPKVQSTEVLFWSATSGFSLSYLCSWAHFERI
jgi:hypothetical protein